MELDDLTAQAFHVEFQLYGMVLSALAGPCPNVVKVVTDASGFALYFSRSLIPFPRHKEGHQAFEHIGIYGYQKDFLLKLTRLAPTPLEKTEALEQLRVIENGFNIKVILTEAQDYIPLSIDTREDLEKARVITASIG